MKLDELNKVLVTLYGHSDLGDWCLITGMGSDTYIFNRFDSLGHLLINEPGMVVVHYNSIAKTFKVEFFMGPDYSNSVMHFVGNGTTTSPVMREGGLYKWKNYTEDLTDDEIIELFTNYKG